MCSQGIVSHSCTREQLPWCLLFKAGHTVRMLLKVAKKTVPRLEWKRTPVVLRATAGLRLLPAEKAQALLDQVKHHSSVEI